ncbi:PGF-pre-PGF domain-containing protein [archaeon]|nr:PGF-pre-PGF domain-containing protein [archaeon]
MILFSNKKKPNNNSNSNNKYDFTVSISPYLNDAIVTPENAWANIIQKINYSDKFITEFNKKGHPKVNLNNNKIYDTQKHKKLIDSCKTNIEKTYSNCLRDINPTKSSVNLSKIFETTTLNDSAKKELNDLLKYEQLMFNAVNQLKQKSNQQNQLNPSSTNTNKNTSIKTQIYNAISKPKETVKKTASMAFTSSLVIAGFGALINIDDNHKISTNNIDTIYQNMLSQLDSIQPNIPDLIPKAAASSNTIDNKEISNSDILTENKITVEITPANKTIDKNEYFILNVSVSDIPEPIIGMQADIEYDPSVITINYVVEGNLFTQDGAPTFFVDNPKDDTAGIRKNTYTAILGEFSVNTPENFITLNLTAKEQIEETYINITNVVISDPQGQAVPYTINNCTVTIYDTTTSTTDPTNSDSAGGGGGGGGSTGEDIENIIYQDVLTKSITNQDITNYDFNDSKNPIIHLEFYSPTNKGLQDLKIQVLKDKSALVKEEPKKNIVEYINIYLGKFGTDNNLENIQVQFSISDEIMTKKSVGLYSIRLMYWNDTNEKWDVTDTKYTKRDYTNNKYIFTSNLTQVSENYAIVGDNIALMYVSENMTSETTNQNDPTITQQTQSNSNTNQKSPPSTKSSEIDKNSTAKTKPEKTPMIKPLIPPIIAYGLYRRKKRNKLN